MYTDPYTDPFIRSNDSELLLHYYPITLEAEYERANTESNLDYFERLSRKLFNLHILAGESQESEKVQRIWDSLQTIQSMRNMFRYPQFYEKAVSKEESLIFLTVTEDEECTIQSFAEAALDEENKYIHIRHLFTAPWNLPHSLSAQISFPPIKGAGTHVLNNAIAFMHSQHPEQDFQVKAPHSAVPFFSKKFGFKIEKREKEVTSMSLSKNKAGKIAHKVFKAIKK